MENYQLFTNQLSEKLKQKIDELKDLSENSESYVDSHVEFMKEEIIIKTESLKIELDKLCDKLCESLDAEKEKVKERIGNVNVLFTQIKLNKELNETIVDSNRFFDDQKKLKLKSKWLILPSTLRENSLKCEKYLENTNESESSIYKTLHELKFIASETVLGEDVLGEITTKDKKHKGESTNEEPPITILTENNFYCQIYERFITLIGRINYIKYRNGAPSWGFITRYDTNEEIYFKNEDLIRCYPEEGQRVIFNIYRNDRGPKAINIKLFDPLHTIRR